MENGGEPADKELRDQTMSYLTADRRHVKILSTPVEDYSREVRRIRTLADVRAFEAKFKLVLDDAAEAFGRVTEETFAGFIEQLPLCFGNSSVPSDDWMASYSAIPLPKLFIEIVYLLHPAGIASGIVLSRLIDVGKAEIKDGIYILKGDFLCKEN